jgi:hypothetical protein
VITGFLADLEVNDGVASASVAFDGLVTLTLGGVEAPAFDATELNQGDNVERMEPVGTLKQSPVKAEVKFTKANYTRLRALVGVKGKVWKVISPDDQSDDTPVKLTATVTGFLSKLDDIKFEKGNPVIIPIEITPSVATTAA